MAAQNEAQGNAGVVEVEGARLRYVIEGHGLPGLVIGSSAFYPRVFSRELREQLQLVFVDLRHFADCDSAFSPDRVSIETYTDDIEHVRQDLGLGDVFVIGPSLAGTIALEHARRKPEHVRGVVTVGAPPYRPGPDESPTPSERFWEADASEERKEIFARRLAELTPEVRAALSPVDLFVRTFIASDPKSWFDPLYDSSWLWEGVVPDMAMIGRVYDELFKPYDLAQRPGEITVPVLVVHGRYDYLAPYTLWEERLNVLPRHTFALLERSGHTPPLDEPERFDETLLDWVHGLEDSSR